MCCCNASSRAYQVGDDEEAGESRYLRVSHVCGVIPLYKLMKGDGTGPLMIQSNLVLDRGVEASVKLYNQYRFALFTFSLLTFSLLIMEVLAVTTSLMSNVTFSKKQTEAYLGGFVLVSLLPVLFLVYKVVKANGVLSGFMQRNSADSV